MRTMLLSFKPSVYEKIRTGIKIFEHRRSFPNEPIKAYMYVSSPICAITGIVYLGRRHELKDWEREFVSDKDAVERIKKYRELYNYAMEIVEFQETTEILLSQLRTDIEGFIAPQMYYYLDGKPLLAYLEDKLESKEINIKHTFENITSSQVCVH
nr:MAG TPA: helix-turn-helix domain-containing protein [Caudoviricetes sp.]